MYIFSIGDHLTGANALADQDWKSPTSAEVLQFNPQPDEATPQLSRNKIHSLVFTGHADTRMIGDYDAVKFVKRLNAFIPSSNRSEVKHVYLLGCEVGAYSSKYDCLAQRIANELHKQGYANTIVHAIASPEQLLDGAEMTVQLVERANHRTKNAGEIAAYILNKEEVEQYHPLKNQFDKLARTDRKRAILQNDIDAIQEQSIPFLTRSTPRTVLHHERNTFKPNESVVKREQRILDDKTAPYHADDLKFVIQVIDHRIIQLQKEVANGQEVKHKNELIEKLKVLNADLAKCTKQPWLYADVVREQLSSFKSNSFFSAGTTHKILEYVAQRRPIAAFHLLKIKGQELHQRTKHASPMKAPEAPLPPPTQPEPVIRTVPTPPAQVPPVISTTASINNVMKDIEIPKDLEGFARAPLMSESRLSGNALAFAINHMNLLIDTLRDEDNKQNSKWYSFLYFFSTKQHKIRELQTLVRTANTESPENFMTAVINKRHNDFRFTLSWKTDRTRSLLDNIIDGTPENWSIKRS